MFVFCRILKFLKFFLLEDVKKRVNYDCRVYLVMYMCKYCFILNLFVICFSFCENDNYNYIEVKDILELQIGFKVCFVQYDFLLICLLDVDVGMRWIVMYVILVECEFVVSKGFEVNGDKIVIKLFDDVINCECEVYILYKEEER